MRDIERYLNVRSATGGSLGPDGELAFRMDATGTFQVWSLDRPDGWPEQRTFFDEPVTFVDHAPDGTLAFGMDEGGNERQQLHALGPDGEVTDLTRHPDAKHYWGGWDSTGDRFAFASNRREESVFDLYVQDADETGDAAERVREGEGWISVVGWSPDDATLAVHESHSNVDQDVYALDLESGEYTCLTDDADEVRYASVSWGPDGGLYVVTDRGSDTLYLARLSLDGDLEAVADGGGEPSEARRASSDEQGESDGKWNVDGVAVDEESGRFVYSRNVDGYTELTVGELTGPTEFRELPAPAVPRGVAGGVSWGPDAEAFAITVTADALNANVFVVDVATGEARRWTRAATAGVPRSSFVPSRLVRYETFDGREIPAFFAAPPDATPGETPVVVRAHGGPEGQHRPWFGALKQYFLANGYAYFEPNIRGSTGYGRSYMQLDDVEKRMDSVADVKAGYDWLASHDLVDPDRVAITGGSYGGFVVLAALTEYPDLWAAGVDIVGIANFVTFLENTGSWRREQREAEYGSLAEDREFLESISPINRVDRIRAPLFVLHGANDPRVPVGEAEQIAAEASEHVPVEKLVFEDEGHGISKLENKIEAYSQIVAFLDEHV